MNTHDSSSPKSGSWISRQLQAWGPIPDTVSDEDRRIEEREAEIEQLKQEKVMKVFTTPLPARTIIDPDGQQHEEAVVGDCTICHSRPAMTVRKKHATYYLKTWASNSPICKECDAEATEQHLDGLSC